jgi:hypothetical protein
VNDLRGKGGSAASLRADEARQLNKKKEAGLYLVAVAIARLGLQGQGFCDVES